MGDSPARRLLFLATGWLDMLRSCNGRRVRTRVVMGDGYLSFPLTMHELGLATDKISCSPGSLPNRRCVEWLTVVMAAGASPSARLQCRRIWCFRSAAPLSTSRDTLARAGPFPDASIRDCREGNCRNSEKKHLRPKQICPDPLPWCSNANGRIYTWGGRSCQSEVPSWFVLGLPLMFTSSGPALIGWSGPAKPLQETGYFDDIEFQCFSSHFIHGEDGYIHWR